MATSEEGILKPFMLLAAMLLCGCAANATKSDDGVQTRVCYVKALGQTEEGYAVLMEACQSPEAFAASQK